MSHTFTIIGPTENEGCCQYSLTLKHYSQFTTKPSYITFINCHSKDQIPKDLTSGAVYKFQCGLCNESYYSECVRHLDVRIGEHTGTSAFSKKTN